MQVDDDVAGKISVEVSDLIQPEGGNSEPAFSKGLDSPNCGSSLLDHGDIQCVGDWEDGSLKESGDRFRPQNLDTFYLRIYEYCKERGYQCIVATRILNLLALTFMIAFTGFLTLFVNWKVVMACTGPDQCAQQDMVNTRPFTTRWEIDRATGLPVAKSVGFPTIFILLFLLFSSAFLLQNAVRCVQDIKEFWIIKKFMNDRLKISEADMETIEWNEIIDKLVKLQDDGVLITRNKITPLDITNRIMRKDNFFIAMINKGVVCVDFPPFKGRFSPFLTKTMEWNLNYCIINHMYDPQTFAVKQRFISNPEALSRRLFLCGLMNLVLSPFIALFVLLYSFFKHGQEMHKNPGSLGARHWSPMARWKMREFNELDHFCEKRMNASYPKANLYVSQFPALTMSIVAKFVVFVGSSICGVIIILSLMDEALLLHVQVFDRNLLWYLAICGLIVASARPLVIDRHENFEPDQAFTAMVEHTHYFPSRWRNKVHSPETYAAFSVLFPFKVATFLYEMLSIFVVPLILIFYLPKQAGDITRFVKDFTETRSELGDVCSFAVFDFERHGNAKYGSHVPHDKYYRSRQGKMEKSFITFLANNPNWEPSENGKLLVRKVQERQQEMTASMQSLASDKFGEDSMSSMHSSLEDLAGDFNYRVGHEV